MGEPALSIAKRIVEAIDADEWEDSICDADDADFLARAVIQQHEQLSGVPALLEENKRLVKALNESPELLEAVRVACTEEGKLLDTVREALKEALDHWESWERDQEHASTDSAVFDRIAELRRLT